ncbi:MAG: MBL fold metallo-hydrolase [Opitutales bacterium]
MKIPIEDSYKDVIEKAAVGQGLGHAALAERADLSLKQVRALIDGDYNETHVRRIAPLLGLNADKLVFLAEGTWRPKAVKLPGLEMMNMPFPWAGYPNASVNAYVIWNQLTKEGVAFDAGAEAAPILKCLDAKAINLKALFLTHTHPDHVGGCEAMKVALPRLRVFTSAGEAYPGAEPVKEGAIFELCGFRIRVIGTNGHSPGALSFQVRGLPQDLVFVGDSLFCLSMGGARTAYQLALQNNREKLMSLPGETVLCPGHGPMTSVAEERAHNPFF